MGFFDPLDSLLYHWIIVYSIFCKQYAQIKFQNLLGKVLGYVWARGVQDRRSGYNAPSFFIRNTGTPDLISNLPSHKSVTNSYTMVCWTWELVVPTPYTNSHRSIDVLLSMKYFGILRQSLKIAQLTWWTENSFHDYSKALDDISPQKLVHSLGFFF